LPITGPGLDLAAELGRAENKDILESRADDPLKEKREKKGSSDSRKVSGAEAGMEPHSSPNEVDTLRSEIKSLKDANKALSLYASKIIDRIIAQEGFEHVLAVDYEAKSPATPTETMTSPNTTAEADKKTKTKKYFIFPVQHESPSAPRKTYHVRLAASEQLIFPTFKPTLVIL
jgi:hypothetical protein